eukprot:scaffold288122_cov19-Prasinocladus_malaysianus.AAC.1
MKRDTRPIPTDSYLFDPEHVIIRCRDVVQSQALDIGRPIRHKFQRLSDIPLRSDVSQRIGATKHRRFSKSTTWCTYDSYTRNFGQRKKTIRQASFGIGHRYKF